MTVVRPAQALRSARSSAQTSADRLQDRAVAAAYEIAWATVRRMPESAAHAAFRTVSDVLWRRRGRGVSRLEANLRRVVGAQAAEHELRQLSRTGMRSYLRYWCDAFRLPDWTADQFLGRVVPHDEARLWDALVPGRGAIAVLPHMANWDLAGAWAVTKGAQLVTVAERLRPESVFDRFVAYREALGMEVLPLTGGGASTFGTLAARARAGGLVCLLGDRDLTATGVEVSFFGAPARLPAGPAALALSTGAALLPVTLWYEAQPPGAVRMHLKFHPYVEIPADGSRLQRVAVATQLVADVLATGIAAHPTDWHMLQRVWLDDLQPVRQQSDGG